MKDNMPKKAALKDLVKAMKSLDLEKVKGYKKAKDEEPMIEATQMSREQADKLKKKFEQDED